MKWRRLMGVAPWAEGNTLAHHGTTTVQCGTAKALMSALGQKQTSDQVRAMSALPPKADMLQHDRDVRFGSLADIALGPRHVRFTPKSGHTSGRYWNLVLTRLF